MIYLMLLYFLFISTKLLFLYCVMDYVLFYEKDKRAENGHKLSLSCSISIRERLHFLQNAVLYIQSIA